MVEGARERRSPDDPCAMATVTVTVTVAITPDIYMRVCDFTDSIRRAQIPFSSFLASHFPTQITDDGVFFHGDLLAHARGSLGA